MADRRPMQCPECEDERASEIGKKETVRQSPILGHLALQRSASASSQRVLADDKCPAGICG